MPTHLPGAVTTGHELLTAERFIVSTKRMHSAAEVITRGNNTGNNMISAHTSIYEKLQKKKLGTTPELQQTTTNNKQYIEQRDECS
jgi:hypothetical protein